MKAIVGLGNPGEKYQGTRHNIGFAVIDQLLKDQQIQMTNQKFQADTAIWHAQGERVLLIKPFTYMNASGQAVLPLMSYYGVASDEMVVVYDDLDLVPGRLRLRLKGSAGGHNGMKSIIEMLGTQDFKRIRVGIGRPQGGWKVRDHVLAPFDSDSQPLVDESVLRASQALQDWVGGQPFEQLMQAYNQKD